MTTRLHESVSQGMSRATTKRDQLIAAITHDAWTIARAGTAENGEWRAAVRRLRHASAQLDQLDTEETER